MAITRSYDTAANIVYVHPGECLTAQGMSTYFLDLLADDAIQPGFIEVVPFYEVTEFNLNSSDAMTIRRLFTRLEKEKSYGGAVVITKTDLQFGMARIFESLMNNVLVLRDTVPVEEGIERLRAQGKAQ